MAANAFASLNKLAPGRIDIGIGTGFTGRRAMGMGAIKLAAFEEYIRVMTALLREETVEAELEGQRHKIRLLNPELGLINTRDPIGLHISAYGPKGRALTAKLGAGWLNFVGGVEAGIDGLEDMQKSWQAAGRARSDLSATAFALGCVLAPGEPYDSPRAMAQAGPRAAVVLHRAADEAIAGLPNSTPPHPSVAEAVRAYVELARTFEPDDAKYLNNHRGHLMFVKPEERPIRHRRPDPHDELHRDRAGADRADRSAARCRLHRVHRADRARPGAGDRGLGADQAGVRLGGAP